MAAIIRIKANDEDGIIRAEDALRQLAEGLEESQELVVEFLIVNHVEIDKAAEAIKGCIRKMEELVGVGANKLEEILDEYVEECKKSEATKRD